ncbi:MAG: 3-hydroxyacyl-[acyl-carrier-protein] dehydratase FabA, partial [Myxococcales bacterium]
CGWAAAPAAPLEPGEEHLDADASPWIGDHRPTHTVPALPAMYMLDRLAQAAERAAGVPVREVREVLIRRWAPVVGELRTRDRAVAADGGFDATFEVFRDAPQAALSRFEPAAQGHAIAGDYPEPPEAWGTLADASVVDDPYASGALFHGPSLRLVRELRRGPDGASAVLDLDAATGGPVGALNATLLDAATHAIPHDALAAWFPEIDPATVAYPAIVRSLRLFGPPPTSGLVQLEVRPDGLDDGARFPRFRLQLRQGDRVWAEMVLVEALFPRGPLGALPPAERRSFLRRERAVDGGGLGRFDGEATRLTPAEVGASNWLPGTIESVYGASMGTSSDDLAARVAVQEHLARQLGVHPSAIEVDLAAGTARCPRRPFEALSFTLTREGDEVTVRSPAAPRLDTSGARAWWAQELGRDTPAVADIYLGLAERFLGGISVEDPAALAALRGQSVVFLANHQVMVESPLFSMLMSSLIDGVVVTVAKVEHQTSWLGRLIAHSFSYPGVTDPVNIVYFDRADKASLLGLAVELQQAMAQKHRSLLVHVEGTRALAAGAPVEKISSIWADVAIATGAPVVPVRFARALPVSADERIDFPVGYGQQFIHVGAPIAAASLQALPLPERKRLILDGINAAAASDRPTAPDEAFADAVEQWRRRTGVNEAQAVLLQSLEQRPGADPETRELVRAIHAGRLDQLPATPEGLWVRGLARQLA